MSDDYAERAAKFGLTSKEEVKEIAKDSKAIFLDVRSEAEVEAESLTGYTCVFAPCTMADTSKLTSTAAEILPDKDGRFCLSLRLSSF